VFQKQRPFLVLQSERIKASLPFSTNFSMAISWGFLAIRHGALCKSNAQSGLM
jgi:hypothetical protein